MTIKKKPSITLTLLVASALAFYFIRPGSAEIASNSNLSGVITGHVMSKYGPVANARVRIAGDDNYELSDINGQFILQYPHGAGNKIKVTAGKEGWFNNEQIDFGYGRTKEIFLNPVYMADHAGYQFISPVTCSRCHIELTRYWDQSKMAHTTSNPKVLDMYYGTDAYKREDIQPGYRLDNPRSNGNCATCHAPSAAASSPWSQDLNSVLRSPRTEWDGISCDYCHKIRKVIQDKTKPSGVAPILERQSASKGSSILVFGPYDDVVAPPMAATYNPLLEQGEFCSMCHGHFEPLGANKSWDYRKIYSAEEWQGFGLDDGGLLPIQTTYQEWKQWQDQLSSDDPNKGKTCQDCHLSWRKKMLPYGNYVVDGMARTMWATKRSPKTIHPHHFEGGTEAQLKTALSMEMEGEITGQILKIRVFITNTNGGHWVPTGEPMRSVMLVLKPVDSNGESLKMVNGSRLPEWTGTGTVDEGNYSGLPGKVFAKVLQDDMGNIHVPFWRATGIASDTRIRPKDSTILTFEFALEDPDDEPTVEADLIYRPVIRPLSKQKSWTVKDILITSIAW